MIEDFTVNGHSTGETTIIPADGKCTVSFKTSWTFPLNFAEIISGDGKKVYRERIDLTSTQAFGTKTFNKVLNMKGRKWVRLEVWDAAVDGAFTQTVWLK